MPPHRMNNGWAQRTNDFWKDKGSILNLVILFFLTLLFFHLRYGLRILDPSEMAWMMKYDWAQHYLGWYFFRNEPWTFPLGEINNLFYPIGTNIGFTDGIPLITIPLKLLSPILPEQFNFFGIWLFSIHILIAFFSIKFFEQIGVKGIPQLLGIILITFSPVLIYRAMHVALATHWVVVANFWIYFMDPKKESPKKILLYQFILLLVGGLINPYFAVINGGFLFILSLKLWLSDKVLNFSKVVVYILGSLVVLVTSWVVTGFFQLSNASHLGVTNAYGVFSWNVSSLFNPFNYDRFYDFYSNNLSHYLPAKPLLNIDQYESFSYLGLGLLILSVLIILACFLHSGVRAKLLSFRKSKAIIFLVAFTILVTIFAISNIVSFNDKVIFRYPLPEFLKLFTDIFRASGRYIWLGYYLWIFFLVYVLHRIFKKEVYIIATLILVCAIQFSDIRQMIFNKKLNYGPYKTILNEPAWYSLIESSDKILLLPPLQSIYLTHDDWRYFSFMAAKLRKAVSAGHVARIDFEASRKFSEQVLKQIQEKKLDSTAIYVALQGSYSQFLTNFFSDKIDVLTLDGYMVIATKKHKYPQMADAFSKIKKETNQDFVNAFFRKSAPLKSSKSLPEESLDVKSGIYEISPCKDSYVIRGWAFVEKADKVMADSINILIKDPLNNNLFRVPASRFGTQDVADFFNNPKLTQVGFMGVIDTEELINDHYQLGIEIIEKQKSGEPIASYKWLQNSVRINNETDPIPLNLSSLTEGIQSDINVIQKNEDAIEIEGWAFSEKIISRSITYLAITKDSTTIAYKTSYVPRADVATFFNNPSRVHSGFMVKFDQSKLAPGEYNVSIIIQDLLKNKFYVSKAEKILLVNNDSLQKLSMQKLVATVKPKALETPIVPDERSKGFIDRILEQKLLYVVEGWAFIDKKDNINSQISLVLKSNKKTFEINCQKGFRPDVKEAFKSPFKIDSSGFKVGLKKEDFPKGEYELFLLIKCDNDLSCLKLDKSIEF